MYITGKTEYRHLEELWIQSCQVELIIKLGEGMVYINIMFTKMLLNLRTCVVYSANKYTLLANWCTVVGEFGEVFKGKWVHEDPDGNTISQMVAIKAIKST